MSSSAALAVLEIAFVLVGLGMFFAYAISYMRAINALSSHLDIERSGSLRTTPNWLLRALFFDFHHSPRGFFGKERLTDLVLGLRVLESSDQRSREILLLARKRLFACLLLFLTGVIAAGWFFRDV